MNTTQVLKLFEDTAYVRTGGSAEEKMCAEYLKNACLAYCKDVTLAPFAVDMATIQTAELTVDGVSIPCKGYLCAGSHEVEAPFYYLRNTDAGSLSRCRGKIVMIDGYLGYWVYRDILKNGAVGFITYDGNANYADCDIDQRELRSYVSQGDKLPGVNINAKAAIDLIQKDSKTARIVLKQEEFTGESQNVIAVLPGEIAETIVLSAHYDSTSLSQGAYDNMSGCVGLLGLLEYFSTHPHRYGLRFLFCGSEERGLLGSKAYVGALSEEEKKRIVLNINLDMIGCAMGKFIACCSAEEKLVHYITYLSLEKGFGVSAKQDVYSSDSTPFADQGIPSLSFARIAPPNTATIHNSYDTVKVMNAAQMLADTDFIRVFTERMATAEFCPVAREIPEKVKEKLDVYLLRKRSSEK